MMTFAFGIDPWPRALEIADVEKHKKQLVARAIEILPSGSRLASRSISRGALSWERWLLDKNAPHAREEQVISSLELARDAGDWKEAELLLTHYANSPQSADAPFVAGWRDLIRENLLIQVENEQRLEIAFQRFRSGQSLEDETARLELARELTTQAKAIGEIGSPVAVNNLLARICASVGWNEEAETYYMGLVVCRPLWIPYIVQLSEHQAKADIKRAFHTLERAKALLGKDFWLVT